MLGGRGAKLSRLNRVLALRELETREKADNPASTGHCHYTQQLGLCRGPSEHFKSLQLAASSGLGVSEGTQSLVF